MSADDPDLTSDHAFRAFLLACEPSHVQLDRAAHATPCQDVSLAALALRTLLNRSTVAAQLHANTERIHA